MAALGGLAVAAGQLLLIPPGEPDAFAWDPRRTTRHGYAHFTIAGRSAPGLAVDRPVLRQLTESDPQSALCRYLVALGGSGPEAVRRRSRQVLGLLLDIVVDPAGDPTTSAPADPPTQTATPDPGGSPPAGGES